MRLSVAAVALLALGVCAQNPVTRSPAPTTAAASTTFSSPSLTQSYTLAPSPTNSGVCTAHLDHWHCDGSTSSSASASEGEETISESDTGGCTQHGNHFHCPAGVMASCDFAIGSYSVPLHVGALFALLAASAVGVFVPVLAGRRIGDASSQGALGWLVVRPSVPPRV